MSSSLSHPSPGDVNKFVLTIRTFDVLQVGRLDVVEKAVAVLFDKKLFQKAKSEVPHMSRPMRLPPGFRLRFDPNDLEFGWVVERCDADGNVVAKIAACSSEGIAERVALAVVGR